MGLRTVVVCAGCLLLAGSAAALTSADFAGGRPPRYVYAPARVSGWHGVEVRVFFYRAHNGGRRRAFVLLPSWYGPGRDPPLPLVISPHGRGVSARAACRLWGDLPTVGGFGVVCPEGQGAHLRFYSWGARGQVDDLSRMPALTHDAFPWVRADPRRVYAIGGSMGGQEALLLLARFPRLLAGVISFDGVADLARQYWDFARLRCDRVCGKERGEPLGRQLQRFARLEVGGTPKTDPAGYAARSALHDARKLAFADVPIELWWSTSDLIVLEQAKAQSGALLRRILALNDDAPVEAFVGRWRHTREFAARARLPFALAQLGLMPPQFLHRAYALHEIHFLPRRYLDTLQDRTLMLPPACAQHAKGGRPPPCRRR
jgi:pimeloyl-ACP methyl ester carboxylesterase